MPIYTTYVIQSRTRITTGNNLNGGISAVANLHGDGERRKTESALASDVHQVRREGHVEVGDRGAKANVDEEIGPWMMEGELDSTIGDGPLGSVADAIGNAAAYVSDC